MKGLWLEEHLPIKDKSPFVTKSQLESWVTTENLKQWDTMVIYKESVTLGAFKLLILLNKIVFEPLKDNQP